MLKNDGNWTNTTVMLTDYDNVVIIIDVPMFTYYLCWDDDELSLASTLLFRIKK